MLNPTIKFKKLSDKAKIPNYAHKGDAGLDLYTIEDKMLLPGQKHPFKTGISFELDKGYAFIIKDKSGLAIKHSITTLGGVIEHTYRGEVIIILKNLGDKPVEFKIGDKIAQALIIPIASAIIEETTKLSKTIRGDRGFGSTGR